MTNQSSTKPTHATVLTINGGSSSIKFAMFEAGDSLRRILEGGIERIGLPEATLRVKGLNQEDNFSRIVTATDHTMAVNALMDWIEERIGRDALTAVGHRVVHGGPKYSTPQRITAEMVEELRRLSPRSEIALDGCLAQLSISDNQETRIQVISESENQGKGRLPDNLLPCYSLPGNLIF